MIEVRAEVSGDVGRIHEITTLAFRDMPFSDGDEQDLIDGLRDLGVLSLSLVAEEEGEVLGQITFSPASLSDGSGPWYALGPVSVLPQRQGEGIGSLLINRGLAVIVARGALGCILTGNPTYYQRFGFDPCPTHCPENESPEHFMLKRLADTSPNGRFAFHSAFYKEWPEN